MAGSGGQSGSDRVGNGKRSGNGRSNGNGNGGNGGSGGNGRPISSSLARSSARRRKRQRVRHRGAQGLLIVGGLAGIGVLSAFIVFVLTAGQAGSSAFASLNRDLPSISTMSKQEQFKTAQIYDRNGTLLWEFYDAEVDDGRSCRCPRSRSISSTAP